MDYNSVITNFRFFLDKLDTGTLGEIEEEAIELAINNATETFIKNKYRPIEQLIYRADGFEQIQKRIDDLRVLVTTKELSPSNTSSSGLTYFSLDLEGEDKYQFYLRGSIKVENISNSIGIKIDKQDNLEVKALDPFNKSTVRRARAFFEGNSLVIIHPVGITTIQKLNITFLKRFKEFSPDNTIELAEHTHREIIQLAVQQTLEVLESQRVQTNQEKVLSSE